MKPVSPEIPVHVSSVFIALHLSNEDPLVSMLTPKVFRGLVESVAWTLCPEGDEGERYLDREAWNSQALVYEMVIETIQMSPLSVLGDRAQQHLATALAHAYSNQYLQEG